MKYLGLLFVISHLFLLFGTTHWERVVATDVLEVHKSYLAQLQKGEVSADASIRERDWKAAKAKGTVAAYEGFLEKYPEGEFSNCAHEEIRELEWEDTILSDYVSSYQKYLAKYPEGKYSAKARERLQEIRELNKRSSEVKSRLQQWEEEAPEVVKKEIHTIKVYKDAVIKGNSIVRLGRMGKKAKGAIPILIQMLDDDTPLSWLQGHYRVPTPTSLATEAEKALVLIGVVAGEPLIYELKSWNWRIRRRAAVVLGEIKDKRAVGSLIHALNDKETKVRGSVAEALGKIKDRRAIIPLMIALTDKDFECVYQSAWNALRQVDPYWKESREATDTIQEYIEILKNEGSYRRRKFAADVLKGITLKNLGTSYEKWKNWWEEQTILRTKQP